MKIRKHRHEALIEQENILRKGLADPRRYVVLFPNKEKLLVVLQNILDGKFVELLVENKVCNYYINMILKKEIKSYSIFPISSLIDGAFTWNDTCQGVGFWYGIDKKLKRIIQKFNEDRSKQKQNPNRKRCFVI